MASLPSPSAVIQRPRSWRFTDSSLSNVIAIPVRSRLRVFCSCNNIHISNQQPCHWANGVNRREIMLGSGLALFSFQEVVSNALAESVVVAEDYRTYTDEANKFRLVIPQDWQVGNGEPSGFKSVTAFYPQETLSSNVSVVISGLGPDFTRMESFGKVEEFADTLVSGLDRSWKRPPGVAAKLIDCRSSKGIYYIEYTLQNPGESRKHLYSAIGMANNGWYNRLYTITGQMKSRRIVVPKLRRLSIPSLSFDDGFKLFHFSFQLCFFCRLITCLIKCLREPELEDASLGMFGYDVREEKREKTNVDRWMVVLRIKR